MPETLRSRVARSFASSKQQHSFATPTAAYTHLIVMVNGLFGGPSNWDVIIEELHQHLDDQQTLLHASQVNTR
jgi:hypothetical protein